ncbi:MULTISPECIES: riboflavin synthase subunit alpha [unclassified Oceanobacter]|uniref:riboflavin synthase subunit alpha n=1 Tax=unclassified Oceanobacter TaxID=2620260 RepID=UPI0027328ED0|nr:MULTISPECIES: riboflavin synthase subunit alpha [unclassified Oceanobacter]MDP2549184.1 riboflavin synthase subunit alpha [Oceanobacter sp. 4_MG-2023]MDP2610157.1 riboflavin synthase subunit alpha [Oceanobacter sp. 1_MG-2023]MDP2613434.1 riboflavin synthase subunit alpha [Oceanobacter sp. 2_MG-2023]
MFTGIVQTRLAVSQIESKQDFATLTLMFPEALQQGLQTGASVALNGTCLTVRSIEGAAVSFDAIGQTLAVTNLGALSVGDEVNIERAARIGDEIGGHLLSGHVMAQVRILQRIESANNLVLWFERPATLLPYLLDKGYVALNGCSLTIAEVEADRFSVHLIPETRDVTTFGKAAVGDAVNLEVDPHTQAVVDTVTRMLADPVVLEQLKATSDNE